MTCTNFQGQPEPNGQTFCTRCKAATCVPVVNMRADGYVVNEPVTGTVAADWFPLRVVRVRGKLRIIQSDQMEFWC